MNKKKIVHVVGARPNFMKIAPLMRAAKKYKLINPVLVHTGQHYSENLSDVFFKDLGLPRPNIFLEASKDSKDQFIDIFIKFSEYLKVEKPSLVIVVGDVTSTVACALATKYLGIKLAHVEAGLRSFDWDMPEEKNRVLTDKISDYLLVTEESGVKNLIKEGVDKKKIYFVGNTMIDSLVYGLDRIKESDIDKKLGVTKGNFSIITLHRPSNVDSKKQLEKILDIFKSIPKEVKLIFPVHPRTEGALKRFDMYDKFKKLPNLIFIEPLGYVDFIGLVDKAKFVLTDSGGIQEETTFLGVPCLTMRENTERPVTLDKGTNKLVGVDKKLILKEINSILKKKDSKKKKVPYWDGKAGERIYKKLIKELK